MPRITTIVASLAASIFLLPQATAQVPQDSKPVRIVLGFPAGSTPDIVTRIVAESMAHTLIRPVIVDNRPGAGGMIAADLVARAPRDGHTLLVDGCSAAGMVYSFVMSDRAPYDPFTDFAPVGRVMRDHWLVIASPALAVQSFTELVALGKSDAAALAFPSPGVGSSPHLQTERVRLRAGFAATHVPYKDNSMPDLIAGRTSFAVVSSAGATSLVRTGKLRALLVLSKERIPALPDVPTSTEAGMPDLIYNAGICLYAPGGTAAAAMARLNTSLNQAQKGEALKKRFAELGVEPAHGNPEETALYIRELMAQVDSLRLAVLGRTR